MAANALRALLAAALALAACACASSRTLGGTFSDMATGSELSAILVADREFDYSDVDVTLYEGRVMLTGTMRSEEGRRKLLANAWKADGVKQVIDEVLIADKTSVGQGLEDARIDQALRARLLSDRGVKSANYKFSVSQGVVYILGVARDEVELDRVLNHARSIAGVEKVVSHAVYRAQTARVR
ncbi:BON domain-containing protein [Amphiplicatus metriothermophilus]|uniref:Osmotically-inducible protein OsmY, contains BON domain n=1 Tax=Amphiplicatus metriothermophilus TaxID=1519374 RepID=A0A239PK91_9PROT|nr:BON domain-containing protein [Amphiplicatus metriothermophilus]MBB5517696.1 osmotically-inducible protein OsmY [Amphiplicatus metriothermophilus]SNT67970.1 Osmotically-inducible protein OsmY, contains BON domain [Amphiplicatus metriothermophilus]